MVLLIGLLALDERAEEDEELALGLVAEDLGFELDDGVDASFFFCSANRAAFNLIIRCCCSSSIETGRLWADSGEYPGFLDTPGADGDEFDDDTRLILDGFEGLETGAELEIGATGAEVVPDAIPKSFENIDMIKSRNV